jgi:uncharacterized membrane protein
MNCVLLHVFLTYTLILWVPMVISWNFWRNTYNLINSHLQFLIWAIKISLGLEEFL